jgi:hypothetical protein
MYSLLHGEYAVTTIRSLCGETYKDVSLIFGAMTVIVPIETVVLQLFYFYLV